MPTFPSISPSYNFIEIPIFRTNIIEYGNKIEQRVSMDAGVRWKFTLHWPTLSDTNKNTIQQFFIARKGRYESFVLNHPRPSQVIGTDSLNYTCKKTHVATSDTLPTTGGDYATYWTQTGDRGIVHAVDDRYLYEFLVRFEGDTANFDYFTWLLWRYNSVKVIEVAA